MDSDSESFVPVFASQSKKRKIFADREQSYQEPPDLARQLLPPEEWLGQISSFSADAAAAPSGPQNQQQSSQLPDHSTDDDSEPISQHLVDLEDKTEQVDYTPGHAYPVSLSSDDKEPTQVAVYDTSLSAAVADTRPIQTRQRQTRQRQTRPTALDEISQFKCNIDRCEKTFSTGSSLKRHIQEHSGDRPHECQFCGNSFVQKSSIKKHIRTQHPEVQPDQPGAQSGGYQFMHSIYFNHCF